MNIIIKDDMVKESKVWKNPMIICFVLAALFPLVLIWDNIKTTEFILGELVFLLFGCDFLYGYLYAIKYKVEFDNNKLYLKTLFKKIELNICDVKKYTCNRYRKSVFYQFNLFINDKKILINTRYKDEFEKVLKDYKIEQIIK